MKLPSILGNRGARDKPKDSYGGQAYSFFFGRSTSGKTVNERTAMQTTAVYSCVRILAEAVASLPIHVYRYTETGKERVYDHPLYYLLHDEPNPAMTSFVFRETLMSHLLIWGNAYAQVIRDGNGRVLSLYPLLPDKMEVDRDEHGQLFYTYTRNTDENPNFNEYGRVRLKPEDVLHIPGLGFDGLVGYSPIAMAKNAVGMTLACEEYGASFFENGATPGGVLEHPGVLKDPARVRESWHSVYGGSKNAGKVAVLEEGMKYQQIGIPPEEAQFLVEQMKSYLKKKNSSVAQSVLDMVPLYLSEGEAEGVRGDIAFAQSCLETGNFTFSGSAVTLSQNNFCGLGVTQRGKAGLSFGTPQLGVRAQVQHLKAYASTDALINERIDPRFRYVKRGCAPYAEWLGQKENPQGKGWAAGAGYGEKILSILNSIVSEGKVQFMESLTLSAPYMVRVAIPDLNIRRGPGTSYARTGKFTGVDVFTIVEESDGWGLLKAYQEKRDGWISLAFTTRI